MALSRRELLGYAVAGTTGMGITAAADSTADESRAARTNEESLASEDPAQAGVGQTWELGRVQARRAEIHDTAITFRASAGSSYDTDYEVRVGLFYRPKDAESEGANDTETAKSAEAHEWEQIGEQTAQLSDGVYLEATETGLETGRTYQYRAEAYLTNYAGPSRRVSPIREVTAGKPCSGPSTNCLRVETLAPEVSESEERVTLRANVRGLDAYDSVTGHFFYQRKGESKQWTEYVPVESGDTGDGSTGEFSATLSDLPAGTYTCYAEARGEGGEMKNMYAEGEKRRFTVE